MPLYRWFNDTAVGDTKGAGVLGVWFVVNPDMTGFPRAMTIGEATAIAQKSACMQTGSLTNVSVYNNATKTWWIDLDTVKAGCSPACVVYESNRSADVNFRCTGLIPPPAMNYSPPVQIKTAQTSEYGQILTNDKGLALYIFLDDKNSAKPTCNAGCDLVWPPLLAPGGNVTGSVPGTLGTVARADGKLQVTYNGMPLYRYTPDDLPGVAGGDGVNNLWFVAKSSLTTFPAPPPPPPSYSGGY